MRPLTDFALLAESDSAYKHCIVFVLLIRARAETARHHNLPITDFVGDVGERKKQRLLQTRRRRWPRSRGTSPRLRPTTPRWCNPNRADYRTRRSCPQRRTVNKERPCLAERRTSTREPPSSPAPRRCLPRLRRQQRWGGTARRHKSRGSRGRAQAPPPRECWSDRTCSAEERNLDSSRISRRCTRSLDTKFVSDRCCLTGSTTEGTSQFRSKKLRGPAEPAPPSLFGRVCHEDASDSSRCEPRRIASRAQASAMRIRFGKA